MVKSHGVANRQHLRAFERELLSVLNHQKIKAFSISQRFLPFTQSLLRSNLKKTTTPKQRALTN